MAGYRRAVDDRLFLEQYLDLPVEATLSARAGAMFRRADIVEVGNLAGSQCRAARHLVGLLPGYLLERGQTWVVFTATSLVRTILASVGASLLDLGPANATRLGGAAADWGATTNPVPGCSRATCRPAGTWRSVTPAVPGVAPEWDFADYSPATPMALR